MAQTYQARYRLLIGDGFREPGELVPEAATWFLVDSLVHHGRLIRVEVDQAELDAAIARWCPELADEVHAAALPPGLYSTPVLPNEPPGALADVVDVAPQRPPARPARTVAAKKTSARAADR